MSGPTLHWIGELAVSALVVIGAFFLLVASYALAKLPDTIAGCTGRQRPRRSGSAQLIASMLNLLLAHGHLSFHELLITIFLFLTAPVTALMVAKAHLLRP